MRAALDRTRRPRTESGRSHGVATAELKAEASKQALAFARELAPGGYVDGKNYFARSPLRADRNIGSFVIQLTGDKTLFWKDFAADDGGDLVDLIAEVKYGGRSRQQRGDAIRWLRNRLGFANASPAEIATRRLERRREAEAAERIEAEQRERKLRRAYEIWLSGKPLSGTLGEKYLEARGIKAREIPNLSPTFRFVPRLEYWRAGESHVGPAIVGRYRFIDGRPARSIHATWLRDDGGDKADLAKPKLSLGDYKGAFLAISRGETGVEPWQGAAPGPLVVTEGPEDAWTEALAAPELRVWAAGSLNNIGNLPWSPSIESYLVVRQNDWQKPAAVAAFNRALAALRRHGVPVEPIGVSYGKDPNDQLRRKR